MLKAAVYARYSSRLQRPTSIDDQVALCRDAAARFACEILEDHIYTDREISGSEVRRDGYQRLLEAARAKAFDAIITEAQDRLWCNQAEMHAALRLLRFLRVKVFSVAAGADITDYSGRVLATVMGLKDEMYLEDLRAKTHRGLAGQARRGFSAGGLAFGYRTNPVTDPTHLDAHGQPATLGYRRVIDADRAAVVRRIFELFVAGWSPKRIVRTLNAEGVAPPRGQSGWTWTAIYGNPRLGTGILNNTLYVGEVVWNKTHWDKDPETGKRSPRVRPRDEWVIRQDETLRVIPQDLWNRVKHRQQELSRLVSRQAHPGGRPHRYLFSGLLVCGACGAAYVMRSAQSYACSFHVNRGPTVCKNTLTVRRRLVEDRLLRVIREELFSPKAVAYLTQRVNEGLRRVAEERNRPALERRRLETELHAATAELEHIRDAIRRGFLSDLTRQMLDETETRVRQLRARLEEPSSAQVHALLQLPEAIRRRLNHLDRVLQTDVDEARAALRDLLGEIVLQPTPAGLMAQLRGNLEGLLALTGEQALVGTTGSGGRI